MLIFLACEVTFDSCSRHHRYKRMIKRRRTTMIKKSHRSPYQRKLRRKSIPINSNYVIKNRNNYRRRGWY